MLCVVVLAPAMQEYCQWETFNATCSGVNEVVLITAARYGRMRVGRCLPVDYYVGCFADVLDHVELRCSGRSSCIISVPDAELFRVQPCRKDLVAYFEAAYRCVPGKHHTHCQHHDISRAAQSVYVRRFDSDHPSVPLPRTCAWQI